MYDYRALRDKLKPNQDLVTAPVLYKDIWVAGPVGSGYETICELAIGAFYHVLGYRDSSWHPSTWLADYSAVLRTITDPSQPPRAMFGVAESGQLLALLPWHSVVWLELSEENYRERVFNYRRSNGLSEAGSDRAFSDLSAFAQTSKAMIQSGCELSGRPFTEIDANRPAEQIKDDILDLLDQIQPLDTGASLRKINPDVAERKLEKRDKYSEEQAADEKDVGDSASQKNAAEVGSTESEENQGDEPPVKKVIEIW